MRIHFIRSLLLAVGMLVLSTASFAQIGVSVTIAPPELPIYEQPICPVDGYIWTPGYWAWDGDYYWVPGTWVMAPEVGFLWTPGYWGWGGNAFLFHEGYWGESIGFYGGINYGFGYFGHGYEGGRWTNGHFFYNTTVNNVNANISRNVYKANVNAATVNHVSFNGGAGGIKAQATAQEDAAAHARQIAPVAAQTQHAQAARNDPQQHLATNHGAPAVAATPQPGAFKDRAVVAAKASATASPRTSTPVHPNDLPPVTHAAPATTGNAKVDQKNQKDQDALAAKQTQERQKLQQQQDKEHQQLTNQKANAAKTQQLEQQHQQQTQQLQQRHTQQMQQLQHRQAPPSRGRPR